MFVHRNNLFCGSECFLEAVRHIAQKFPSSVCLLHTDASESFLPLRKAFQLSISARQTVNKIFFAFCSRLLGFYKDVERISLLLLFM